MNRRNFLQGIGSLSTAGILFESDLLLAHTDTELVRHTIQTADIISVDYHWPRFVGKNGARDVHGQYQKASVLRLKTNQGAEGWGLTDPKASEATLQLVGKRVSDLIVPEAGIAESLNPFYFDFALFDLAGIILNKPVYELLGARGPKQIPIYSGMIYIDELPYKDLKGGLDTIMNNCAWDYQYGYRQLKIKIGRGKNWYPAKEGMAMDIKVFKMIDEEYRKKGVQLLVDANNAYTVDDTITFLTGISGLPLYWIEEPFPEEMEGGKRLRAWMDVNGFSKTRYADGEWVPPGMKDVALDMVKAGIVNTYLNDIHAIGLTNWIKVMPLVQKARADGSPHAWGDRLKTHYTAHLAAGLGNIPTVEGVTCISDDIDYGDYPVTDGNITVSSAPGFGMRLLKK
ncbi:MAG TPA: enolase C-terminal domain-like protein [Cyclobacteriaceae bacterium]|nr:enolase C-terminal domain-like protein [Cyclobacteriaceae bacterium]